MPNDDAINDLAKPLERVMASAPLRQSVDEFCKKTGGQVVLVLQGGGALAMTLSKGLAKSLIASSFGTVPGDA